MSSTGLITLGLVVGLLIGMSSTLIGAFTLYVSAKYGRNTSSNKVAINGLLVFFYMAMLLIIFASVISVTLEAISTSYQQALLLAIPIIGICIGVSFVRRYFWHEPIIHATHAKRMAKNHITKSTNFLQPLVVAGTLLYLISPLLVIVMFSFGMISLVIDELPLFWYVPFTLGIITPIYGVLALLTARTSASKILLWKEKTKATMHLYTGLTVILLAWIVFYVTIQQGGI